jgi:exo-beta-1,3-glucanase (GH17 family)
MSRRQGIAIFSILLALAAVSAIYFRHRPRLIPHRASSTFREYLADRQSRMVVYSPDLDDVATDYVVRKQLSLLRLKFDGIVLYECDGETDLILRTAESLKFHAALLTIWSPTSEEEIRLAAKLVREYRTRMALAVSIGSEGIMEKRYTVHDLETAQEDLFRFADSSPEVETTTTEPWWLYTSSTPDLAKLQPFGDFLCVNIHVIWDTDLTSPATAAEWTADRAKDLARTTGRPVLIREAGFPGGGYSPRADSVFEFNRDLQFAFWQNWNTRFRGSAPPIVAFEGIDNPAKHWKSFESSWGLLGPDLQPHAAWEAFPTL